jgi:hypothetical protein
MKPDLQILNITNMDVEEATGLDNLWDDQESIAYLYAIYERSPEVFHEIPSQQIPIRPSTVEDAEFRDAFIRHLSRKKWTQLGVISRGLEYLTNTLKHKISRFLDRLKPTPLGILLDEVEKYNRVIEEMSFVDQLEEAGNPVTIQDRDAALNTLRQIRADMLTALKTERLFRENPDFSMKDFSLHLSSFQTLELSEHAQEYEQFVNDALDIGLRVHADLRAWYTRQQQLT